MFADSLLVVYICSSLTDIEIQPWASKCGTLRFNPLCLACSLDKQKLLVPQQHDHVMTIDKTLNVPTGKSKPGEEHNSRVDAVLYILLHILQLYIRRQGVPSCWELTASVPYCCVAHLHFLRHGPGPLYKLVLHMQQVKIVQWCKSYSRILVDRNKITASPMQ
jgi:hypothetical protein